MRHRTRRGRTTSARESVPPRFDETRITHALLVLTSLGSEDNASSHRRPCRFSAGWARAAGLLHGAHDLGNVLFLAEDLVHGFVILDDILGVSNVHRRQNELAAPEARCRSEVVQKPPVH